MSNDIPELATTKAARITVDGFRSTDLARLRPNVCVVEPVRPPKALASGLHLAHSATELPGTACVLYRVVKAPLVVSHLASEYVPVVDGDLVVLRNAMLDPIHPSLNLLVIDVKHITAIVD